MIGAQDAVITPSSANPVKNSIMTLEKLKKGIKLGKKFSIQKMKEEGRK